MIGSRGTDESSKNPRSDAILIYDGNSGRHWGATIYLLAVVRIP